MRRRHPVPQIWLVTDPRSNATLLATAAALPRGSGIVFRHYDHPNRRALFEQLKHVARRRRLILVLAGNLRQAAAWRADGVHGRSPHRRVLRPMLRTAPVHNRRELSRTVANVVLVSPVFPTRSHPGAPALGLWRFAALARFAPKPVIALGGMTPARFLRVRPLGAQGWAAIDWFADQNLNVVPK